MLTNVQGEHRGSSRVPGVQEGVSALVLRTVLIPGKFFESDQVNSQILQFLQQ